MSITRITRTRVTKRAAEKVLAAVRKQVGLKRGEAGPTIKTDWDWLGTGHVAHYSIVWEEGPFQWTYLFPYGGIEEEFGFRRPDVSDAIPDGVLAEPITAWAIGLYDA